MKPQIICHIMTPIDGKVDNSRWTAPDKEYGASEMMAQYHAIGQRLGTDAWILGTNTVKQFFPERFDACACHKVFPDQLHTFVGDCSSRRQMIALVPDGDIWFTANQLHGDNIIAVVGENVSADYIEFLEDMQISYVFAGLDGMDLGKAMESICNEFGLWHISLQGNGFINGRFFQAGLVSELSVVVSPQFDGCQGAPSIIEYRGEETDWPQGLTLRLLDVERLGAGCVWLHYQVRQS